ncbi:Uu.00g026670.m01.CDS01 [Anthostomella pinea]|uniref:Uu.00g026670.m01.CDS01 n=1 Tax=Anthostomella pinea TaxID=933095 RepID=A0AAI8YA78_9PEZI|nr:Uu.00g026670.m01.CDS01 [Anthostomella pinea]
MQPPILAAALFAAAASAKSSSNSDSDNLSAIIQDWPECSLACYAQTAQDEGCAASDFNCVCNNTISIAAKIGLCIPSDCDGGAAGKSFGELCARWGDDPQSTEVASATALLASEIPATATASASATASPSGAAGRPEMGMGVMGVAAAAAFLI